MDIRYRLYPHPVLSEDTDDYVNSSFEYGVQLEKGIREIIFKINVKVNNRELETLIEQDKAEYLIHIECPYTCYRLAIKTSDILFEKRIRESALNGKVSICAFLVAKQKLDNYHNEDFNDDYGNSAFNINRGEILAIGGQYDVDIIKETEELTKIPSIFSICRLAAEIDSSMKFNIDGNKIAISLCKSSFENYKILSNMPDMLPVFHSMIIIPSLIYVFETLRREGTEDFEDRRWFKAIKKTLKNIGIELNMDLLENTPSYELAQKLLDLPIDKAMEALTTIGDFEEEDD